MNLDGTRTSSNGLPFAFANLAWYNGRRGRYAYRTPVAVRLDLGEAR